jgi:hypothetical protein
MKRYLLSTLGVAIALASASSAHAFFGMGGCGCAAEPSCGCYAEPACGCAAEPSCGCDLACDSCCSPVKKHCCIFGRLKARLMAKHACCGYDACEPSCGCAVEASCGCAAEPSCGCAAEPACGCAAEPSCGCADSGCGAKKHCCIFARIKARRALRACCAPSCCEPACGCAAEPRCGCFEGRWGGADGAARPAREEYQFNEKAVPCVVSKEPLFLWIGRIEREPPSAPRKGCSFRLHGRDLRRLGLSFRRELMPLAGLALSVSRESPMERARHFSRISRARRQWRGLIESCNGRQSHWRWSEPAFKLPQLKIGS